MLLTKLTRIFAMKLCLTREDMLIRNKRFQNKMFINFPKFHNNLQKVFPEIAGVLPLLALSLWVASIGCLASQSCRRKAVYDVSAAL